MEEIARVYADALFGAARDHDKLDVVREQLGQFADALGADRDLQMFFFSPYFSSAEKREGISRAVEGGDREFVNFLELLAEKHRMPAVFRIRREYERLYDEHNRKLEVTLTSAVELDPAIVEKVGAEVEQQTQRSIKISSEVDQDLLGGLVLRVGNMVLDASLRGKLERLRTEIAKAA